MFISWKPVPFRVLSTIGTIVLFRYSRYNRQVDGKVNMLQHIKRGQMFDIKIAYTISNRGASEGAAVSTH